LIRILLDTCFGFVGGYPSFDSDRADTLVMCLFLLPSEWK